MTSTALDSAAITGLDLMPKRAPTAYRLDDHSAEPAASKAAQSLGILKAEGGQPSHDWDSAEYLLPLIAATADVLLVYDSDGTLRWASPSLGQVFGWCPREKVGTAFYLSRPHGGDDGDQSPWEQWCRVTSPSWIQRRRTIRGDGQPGWVEEAVTIIRDHHGLVTAGVVSARDITAQTHAMQALSESESHLRAVAQHANDVVYQTDRQGTITWISDGVRRALGVDSPTVCDRGLERWLDPADMPRWEAALASARAGDSCRIRVSLRRPDGHSRAWDIGLHPVVDADHEVVGVAGGWREVAGPSGAPRANVRATLRLADEVVQWASPSLMTLLGWSPDEVIGNRILQFVHSDDVERVRQALVTDADDEREGLRFRATCFDGDSLWVELTTARLRRSDGHVTQVVAALTAAIEECEWEPANT